jgi:hypothetical protein
VTNNTAIFIADNKKLKADNLKLIDEMSQLKGNIEELEQYGHSLFSSALISFNKDETIFLIKSGFNKVSWTSLDMLKDSP